MSWTVLLGGVLLLQVVLILLVLACWGAINSIRSKLAIIVKGWGDLP